MRLTNVVLAKNMANTRAQRDGAFSFVTSKFDDLRQTAAGIKNQGL